MLILEKIDEIQKFGICSNHNKVPIPLSFFKSNLRFATKVRKTFPDFSVINYNNILSLGLFSQARLKKNIHSLHQSDIHKSSINITK